ncbi:MAG: AMP-binding protein, partial [bacterium]|nr:AMP-binding protein [bacterium]
AFTHQDYQYEELVEKVVVNRDTGRNPLFGTMLVLQDPDMPEIVIPGLKLTPVPFERGIAKFDLMLVCEEKENQLSCYFEYCTKLFREETIKSFTGYFKKIISSVSGQPTVKISAIEIISTKEKKRILNDYNRTSAPFPREKTVQCLFEEQVERTPNHAALTGQYIKDKSPVISRYDVLITYDQLNERANQLARVLREQGIQNDSIVALMVPHCVEMMIGIMGILKAGGCYLPIDPALPGGRAEYILKDSAAHVLLCYNHSAHNISFNGKRIDLNQQGLFNRSPSNPGYPGRSNDLCYVIYTSGSTG